MACFGRLKIAQTLKLKALPPPYMVEALDNHVINGFCVGEPWNTQGELLGLSKIVCSSQDIIPNVADKVLAVTQEWAEQHPQTLIALTTAIIKAQKELSDLKDFSPVLKLLVDFGIVRFHCSEEVHVDKYYMIQNIVKHLVKENAAPQPKDFYWLFEQMQKWDELQIDKHKSQAWVLNALILRLMNKPNSDILHKLSKSQISIKKAVFYKKDSLKDP